MNSVPPDNEDLSEVDALYRRLSAGDPSRPGEQVRKAVFAHATRLAVPSEAGGHYNWQRAPARAWRRPTAFGALAAALIAVFMWTPRMSAPPATHASPVLAQAPAAQQAPADASTVFADISSAEAVRGQPSPVAAAPAQPGRPGARDALLRAAPQQSTAGALARNQVAAAPAALSADAAARPAARAAPGSEPTVASTAAAAAAVAAADAAAPGGAPAAKTRSASAAALWRAAQDGDLVALRELHDRQVNLDAQDPAGRTALMIATLFGHSQAVGMLLDAGANPNITDNGGESPLDAALAADESEIIAALKRHGAR